jgi:hypothetical protein
LTAKRSYVLHLLVAKQIGRKKIDQWEEDEKGGYALASQKPAGGQQASILAA